MATESCIITKDELLQIKRYTQQDSCTFTHFSFQILIEDFKDSLSNCIYRGECPNYDTLMIVMTVCYAYCLLKCCILFMVWFYQKNRVNSISNNIHNINEGNENQQQEEPQQNQNTNNNNNNNSNNNDNNSQNNQSQRTQQVKYLLYQENIDELNTYETSINLNILVEIAMSIRDFFLFRGLGYFISYLYDVVFVNSNQEQCINSTSYPPVTAEQIVSCDEYKKNLSFYLSTADICVIRYPFFSNEGDENVGEQYAVMYLYIIIWILLECLAGSILFFNTQVLANVNEGGKEQKDINNSNKRYSIFFFIGQVTIMCTLIFGFNIRLYFRFQSVEVLIYYLVWKSLGFMLLLDQYNKKKYLSKKLFIDIAYDKQMNWEQNEEQNYRNAQNRAKGLKNEDMKKEYLLCLERIHTDLKKKCAEKQSQQKKKIQFQWNSYLFFVLITLFLGIVGYSLCLIHYSINQASANGELPDSINVNLLNSGEFLFGKYLNSSWLFWFGFIFCMLESAVFEIFNSVLLLHSYYLQLFEQMAKPPNEAESATTIGGTR